MHESEFERESYGRPKLDLPISHECCKNFATPVKISHVANKNFATHAKIFAHHP